MTTELLTLRALFDRDADNLADDSWVRYFNDASVCGSTINQDSKTFYQCGPPSTAYIAPNAYYEVRTTSGGLLHFEEFNPLPQTGAMPSLKHPVTRNFWC